MKENPRLEEAESRKAKGSLLGTFLEPAIKGQRSKGRGLLPGLRAGDDGAVEAAAELSRTQNKQHVESVMGPPIKSKVGCFGYFITQPLQGERLRSPAGKGRKDLGKTGMAEQRSGDH